ncbi:hypothetical protein HDU93_007269 [Gonapodya sp. JEL0774]|nr:hypothetical protein HDU93_007269 [Gonapodya sp. JEL0774]
MQSGGLPMESNISKAKTGREVALKICYKRHLNARHDFISTPSSSPRLKEIYVLERISSSHPNLCNLLEWWEDAITVVMVNELATGGELFEKIVEQGHYTEADAASITATLCNHGIVHRDIKTENLLFKDRSANSNLVLVDFGLAGVLESADSKALSTVVGTPIYIAPEIANATGQRKYGTEADCWSLGVVTYCLLVGYGPFGMGDFEAEPTSLATSVALLKAGPTIEQLWEVNEVLLRNEGILSGNARWGGWRQEDLAEFQHWDAEGKTTVIVASALTDIDEEESEGFEAVEHSAVSPPAEPTNVPVPTFVSAPSQAVEPSDEKKTQQDEDAYVVEIPTNAVLDNLLTYSDNPVAISRKMSVATVAPEVPVAITARKHLSNGAIKFSAARRTRTTSATEDGA